MRIGLAGAGGIGLIRIKALEGSACCTLVGLTDVDKARALAAAPKTARVFETYQAMLACSDIEAVIVSTPPQFHEAMTLAALEAGKHVLCEKPLAPTVEACRRMVEAAGDAGRVLTTGFNHRYFAAIQFVKQTLESGLIGELDHVRAFGGHTGLSEFKSPWMYDKKVVGGGALMDIGIHLIDLSRYLLGEVCEVQGVATRNVWKLDGSEDNALAILRSPSGKHAILQATWSEWKGYRFHIEAYGDRGMARAYYAPMMSFAITLDKPGGTRRRQRNFYPMNILREKRFGWQWTVVQTFKQEFQEFAALCEGAPSANRGAIADGFSGFRAVEIANAVYQSTLDKQTIRLAAPF